MKDILKLTNVFYGNGNIDLPKPEGIASTWFFIKAQCGNTNPFAALPFGKMTCGAYNGGYPAGYGNNMPNACGTPERFDGKYRGFSHLNQSGTGAIGTYYNYAVTTPLYGELRDYSDDIINESAEPGYYTATFKASMIKAEATVSEDVVYHRYSFSGDGKIMIDFSNCGLSRNMGESFFSYVKNAKTAVISDDEAVASFEAEGIKLCFAVKCIGNVKDSYLWENYKKADAKGQSALNGENRFGVAFDVNGVCVVKVAVSLKSTDNARKFIADSLKDFDYVKAKAFEKWKAYLGQIRIDTKDEKIAERFYSNMYHSLIKPCNWKNESFMYDCESSDFYCDFATLWDMYKSQLPLVYTLYADESRHILKCLYDITKAKGISPIGSALSDNYLRFNDQAHMLAEHTMADGFYRGLIDGKKIIDTAEIDIKHESRKSFVKDGTSDRYTYILDLSEACGVVSQIAKITGDREA